MMEQEVAQQVASEAGILTYIAIVAVLGGVVLTASEGLGRLAKTRAMFKESKKVKLTIAMILGPTVAMIAYGAGHLSSPAEGMFAWFFAGVMGLLGTFTAKGATDLFNKVKK